MWWNPSSTGQFTTKSAYSMTKQPFERDEVLKQKKIQNFWGPIRGSLLLWKVAHDRFLTKSLLWERNITSEAEYEVCGDSFESTIHVVRDCTLPKEVWGLLLPGGAAGVFWTTRDIRVQLMENVAMEQVGIKTHIGNMFFDNQSRRSGTGKI